MIRSVQLALLASLFWCIPAFAQDTDGDGLSDADEAAAGSDPALVDTDADGLGDGAEVLRWGTDPTKADTDGGGQWDLVELFGALTDPLDGADDASSNGGGGTYHYWLDRVDPVNDEDDAEAALGQLDYEAIRAFRWPNVVDFERNEEGDFDVNTPYVGLFDGNRDEYAGIIHGWLYVPASAGFNRWSIAVGAADGWWFEAWYGAQTQSFDHVGGGFRTEREVFDFPSAGGLFPFELVTWEDNGDEALELSWAAGAVDYDDGAGYDLIPPESVYASDLGIQQFVVDVDGGQVMPGDQLRVYVEMTNDGEAAAYAVELQPKFTNVSFENFENLPPEAQVVDQTVTFPIIDASTSIAFNYTVTVDAAGGVRVQAEAWADAFPRNYGIGARRIRVISDDPLNDVPADDGNRPFTYFANGLLDDDPSVFSTGDRIDIDHCNLGMDDCAADESCVKVPGAWECECAVGYESDGQDCVDIDECVADVCEAPATCVNEPGGFRCECPDGYTADGATCVDVDECADGTASCDTNADCTNMPGGFACSCRVGFEGDGERCTSLDCACSDDQVCFVTSCFQRCEQTLDCDNPQDSCFEDRCAADACEGVTCAEGEVCTGGTCFLSCEEDVDCDNVDQRCFDKRCATDPCDDITCAVGQFCYGGGCFDNCAVDADCENPDDRCFDNRCATDPCEDVQCASTQVCYGGGCFDVCGEQMSCENEDEACFDERCAVNACDRVQCASGEVCTDGVCAPVPNTPEDGCGCASSTGGGLPGLMVVVGLWWARRRRRSQRR